MGEIYLGRAVGIEGFERLVALKRLLPSLASDPEAVELFLAEARLTAALHHPNIVHVYEVGESDQNYFFAMEYVHGQNLRSVLRTAKEHGRGLTIAHALAIVRGVAAALHCAHEAKDSAGRPLFPVHRDVSPANVMLTYDGAVKVVDFGIAKAAAREKRTRPGSVRGTVSYMSPEQCRGEDLDRRSDVFSLGVILFELTTGTRLFRGAADASVAEQLSAREVIAPSARLPGYPPALERIVKKALDPERAARHATAQELELDIEEFARDNRVALSSVGLSSFMRDLFADQAARGPLEGYSPTSSATGAVDSSSDTLSASGAPLSEKSPSKRSGHVRALLVGALGALALAGSWVFLRAEVPLDDEPKSASPSLARGGMGPIQDEGAGRIPTPAPPIVEAPTPARSAEIASLPAAPHSSASVSASVPAPTAASRPAPAAATAPARSAAPPAGARASARPSTPWDLDSPLPP
jgi:serine/threonine protein kinase